MTGIEVVEIFVQQNGNSGGYDAVVTVYDHSTGFDTKVRFHKTYLCELLDEIKRNEGLFGKPTHQEIREKMNPVF